MKNLIGNNFHTPVLLSETIKFLDIKRSEWYVDGTIGGGGHSLAIIEKGANVLGIDQDQSAINYVRENLKFEISNFQLTVRIGNFRNIKKIVEGEGLDKKISGVLLDLGVSSFQLDKSTRGFSIRRSEPLDMRMNMEEELSAYQIVNGASEKELEDIIARYGEDEQAQDIARAILTARTIRTIETSSELADIIKRAVRKRADIHPATKTFQAIRIAVNDEIGALKEGINGGFEILKKGGRLAVISFHSLEDRIVKRSFQDFVQRGSARLITKKPIIASREEVQTNRRSRSAKLRVIEKI